MNDHVNAAKGLLNHRLIPYISPNEMETGMIVHPQQPIAPIVQTIQYCDIITRPPVTKTFISSFSYSCVSAHLLAASVHTSLDA
jgi:hypothetical protein